MEVVITEWALQSYLELLGVFTEMEYKEVLRPDAELLRNYPDSPKFENDKFWGPCKDRSRKIIRSGYKMKWHNIGHGRGVQLRLLIVIEAGSAYLCNAYVKDSPSKDFREMEKLRTRIKLIKEGRFVSLGRLA